MQTLFTPIASYPKMSFLTKYFKTLLLLAIFTFKSSLTQILRIKSDMRVGGSVYSIAMAQNYLYSEYEYLIYYYNTSLRNPPRESLSIGKTSSDKDIRLDYNREIEKLTSLSSSGKFAVYNLKPVPEETGTADISLGTDNYPSISYKIKKKTSFYYILGTKSPDVRTIDLNYLPTVTKHNMDFSGGFGLSNDGQIGLIFDFESAKKFLKFDLTSNTKTGSLITAEDATGSTSANFTNSCYYETNPGLNIFALTFIKTPNNQIIFYNPTDNSYPKKQDTNENTIEGGMNIPQTHTFLFGGTFRLLFFDYVKDQLYRFLGDYPYHHISWDANPELGYIAFGNGRQLAMVLQPENFMCHHTCKNCTRGIIIGYCNECNSGSSLINGNCLTDCRSDPSQILHSDGSCETSVKPGFFLKSDQFAQKCSAMSCVTCTGDKCSNCGAGYVLRDDNRCYRSCLTGSYPDSLAVCQKCHSDCKGCSNSSEKSCTSCKPNGKLLSDFSCEYKCNSDQYLDKQSKLCEACHPSCENCSGYGNRYCDKCAKTFFKDNFQACVSYCQNGYSANEITGLCERCSDVNCVNCSEDAEVCTRCSTGFLLEDKKCVSSCSEGKIRINLECENCATGCAACYRNLTCIRCISGRDLDNGKCTLSDEVKDFGKEDKKNESTSIFEMIIQYLLLILICINFVVCGAVYLFRYSRKTQTNSEHLRDENRNGEEGLNLNNQREFSEFTLGSDEDEEIAEENEVQESIPELKTINVRRNKMASFNNLGANHFVPPNKINPFIAPVDYQGMNYPISPYQPLAFIGGDDTLQSKKVIQPYVPKLLRANKRSLAKVNGELNKDEEGRFLEMVIKNSGNKSGKNKKKKLTKIDFK